MLSKIQKMSLLEKLQENLNAFKIIFLICLFGTGSWVEINGIWVELPLLVNQSPQSWSLPSYLTVVIQIANLGPILYFLLNKYCKKKNGDKLVTEIPANYVILSVGVISCFLLAFLWERTSLIGGTSYSSALIGLSFFLALVDCTSSLTFLPFMAYFPAKYMTAYYIGEGMSGFLPSIIALIQGIGGQSYTCNSHTNLKNITLISGNMVLRNVTESVPYYYYSEPRFSTRIFFICIGIMMLVSLASFVLLVRIKKGTQLRIQKTKENNYPLKNTGYTDDYDLAPIRHDEQTPPILEGDSIKIKISKKKLIYLLVLNAIINGLSNGVLPALQSYACLPYGNNIYHLTLVISAIANPVCCFLYFFISLKSTIGISIGVLVYIVSAGFTIGIAATSPCPILNDSKFGGILVLLVTVFGVGLVNYLKTAISTVLRNHGYRVLFWCGVSVQIGSFIGAVITFVSVNNVGLFTQAFPCQQCS
ncbi:solute carrier family 52, riboflavin transporter, member 3-A-like isoform X2 [Clytia hemisphaerica]|uniref:solute carrier family 52, riboflavin transporter, member 3-A-like isoform X2 n=1 Tax=Clytia hemisphaerica TaxID=252671 RepID=UPI0034D77ECA